MASEEFANKRATTSQEYKGDVFSTPLHYEIKTPPKLTPPRVECYLDKEHSIRHMVYVGVLNHEQLVSQVIDIWKQIPDLEKYDNIIDIRFHKGDVGWHTVKEIGRNWNLHFDGKPPQKRTAFISYHTAFTILIKAIQAFAPDHTFKAFSCKKEALAWLMMHD